jgi:peptide/nickel transport system permease protein
LSRETASSPLGSGVVLLALLAVSALAAPWLAPFPAERQLDPAAGRLLPPGSARYVIEMSDGTTTLAEAVRRQGDRLEIRRLGESLTLPLAALRPLGADGLPAKRRFLLGTDRVGRDVFSRLLRGAGTSLAIGGLAALVALSIGLALGAAAGFAGGWVDALVMRTVDALLAFPRLFLVIAIAGLLERTGAVIVLVLGLTGWMGAARLTRAEVRSLKHRGFVEAARAVGQRPVQVVRRHLLPHALVPVLIDTALRVGDIILVEAALSFLGLGFHGAATWGSMVADGAPALPSAWWISTFPSLAIAGTVVGFNLVADGLRDRLDPRKNWGLSLFFECWSRTSTSSSRRR